MLELSQAFWHFGASTGLPATKLNDQAGIEENLIL
jgi:hypothetical protein